MSTLLGEDRFDDSVSYSPTFPTTSEADHRSKLRAQVPRQQLPVAAKERD